MNSLVWMEVFTCCSPSWEKKLIQKDMEIQEVFPTCFMWDICDPKDTRTTNAFFLLVVALSDQTKKKFRSRDHPTSNNGWLVINSECFVDGEKEMKKVVYEAKKDEETDRNKEIDDIRRHLRKFRDRLYAVVIRVAEALYVEDLQRFLSCCCRQRVLPSKRQWMRIKGIWTRAKNWSECKWYSVCGPKWPTWEECKQTHALTLNGS